MARNGDLSERSLGDAINAAEEAGQEPSVLIVGTRRLEVIAHGILSPKASGLDRLRVVMPTVVVDHQLGEGWMLAAVDGDALVDASGPRRH